MADSQRARLADGVRRMRRATYVTRRGMTQIYSRWRPPNRLYNVGLDSDSNDSGYFASDVNEDEVDLSLVTRTLSFSWVELDNDERSYALFHHKECYEQALAVEATLRDRIDTVENCILEALGGERLRSSPGVGTVVITAFAELRVELAELFRGQR